MFRVLDVGPEGPVQLGEGDERVDPPPAGVLRWVDLVAPDDAQLALIERRFGLHPLAIEDCAHFDQRPKLEDYGGHLFVVTHGFRCPDGDPRRIAPQELHAFLNDRWLITVHAEPIAAVDGIWRRACGDPAAVRRGVDFLYYLIVDELVDATFPILDLLADELDQLEESILAGGSRADLSRIFRLKRTLMTMRKVLSPQRDVFAMLARRGDPRVSERSALYFRDVYDHLVRISEAIDAGRDLLGNTLDAHLSMVANRTNQIMKSLTILSAIFLPLTFVTGFFGQNFRGMPFGSDALLYGALAACVVIPAAMLAWFRHARWL